MAEPGIYGWNYGTGGVHFFRLAEPLRVARKEGVKTGTGNALSDEIAEQYDTILVHGLHTESASEAWVKLVANQRHRLIIDVDDAMWWADWKPFKDAWGPKQLERLYKNVMTAHVVTTPSPVIAEYLHGINPNVHVVPNTIPQWLIYQNNRGPNHSVLGYQGSPSHVTDVSDQLRADLFRFLDDHAYWEMWLYGADEKQIMPGRPKVRNIPWKASLKEYYRSVYMDLGLGFLADTQFNRAKSSLRAIEYAALGIPAVFTDLPIYDGYVKHGETGLLVPPGGDWYEPLHYLAYDHDERRAMGIKARLTARSWTTERCIGNWLAAWNSV